MDVGDMLQTEGMKDPVPEIDTGSGQPRASAATDGMPLATRAKFNEQTLALRGIVEFHQIGNGHTTHNR
jgi:hypothetical protein